MLGNLQRAVNAQASSMDELKASIAAVADGQKKLSEELAAQAAGTRQMQQVQSQGQGSSGKVLASKLAGSLKVSRMMKVAKANSQMSA